MANWEKTLRLALPTRALEADTLAFLQSCGLSVHRPNPRQYTAVVPSMEGLGVIFQRAADIYSKVNEGAADLGITGLDMVKEQEGEGDDVLLIFPELGYGYCALTLAVPENWVDVTTVADLAELAPAFKARGRDMRVATKYPRLTQQFLYQKGINCFSLVESTGAIEAAPRMGYADIISDIVETGTTLQENGLKTIGGGVVQKSQACLIGNRRALQNSPHKLATTKAILEIFESRLKARGYYSVAARIRALSPEKAAEKVVKGGIFSALKGPAIAKDYSIAGEEEGCIVTVLLPAKDLLKAIDHLRAIGDGGITVSPVEYIFEARCQAYEELLKSLQRSRS